MSVYVDPMNVCIPNNKWPYNSACHLVADSVKELQLFAVRLGLHFTWSQSKPIPHYDLTTNMRRRAIKFGAIEISPKKFLKLIRKYRPRETGGQPDEPKI